MDPKDKWGMNLQQQQLLENWWQQGRLQRKLPAFARWQSKRILLQKDDKLRLPADRPPRTELTKKLDAAVPQCIQSIWVSSGGCLARAKFLLSNYQSWQLVEVGHKLVCRWHFSRFSFVALPSAYKLKITAKRQRQFLNTDLWPKIAEAIKCYVVGFISIRIIKTTPQQNETKLLL